MNAGFPPLELLAPRVLRRRQDRPIPIFLEETRVNNRRAISENLRNQLQPIRQMTPDQLKAVMIKLRHDRPLPKDSLSGTGLKVVAQSGEAVTLAVVRPEGLDGFDEKLNAFGTGDVTYYTSAGISKAVPPNQSLGLITSVSIGEPKDRLSDPLLRKYDSIVRKRRFIFEIEIGSILERQEGPRRRQTAAAIESIRNFLGGITGGIFDTDYSYGSARVSLWTTGESFRTLVEDARWQTVITFFDERPNFETFYQTFKQFRIQDLGDIRSPDVAAPTVCVIDSGVSSGNPFLQPIVREDALKSYVAGEEERVTDGFGHGSGVASLVGFHSLNLTAGAINIGKVRVASARILDDSGFLDTVPVEDRQEQELREAICDQVWAITQLR